VIFHSIISSDRKQTAIKIPTDRHHLAACSKHCLARTNSIGMPPRKHPWNAHIGNCNRVTELHCEELDFFNLWLLNVFWHIFRVI
jgi:hypothetical protein